MSQASGAPAIPVVLDLGADFCIVDAVQDGQVRRAEVAHRDPAKAALVEKVRRLPSAAGYRSPSHDAQPFRRGPRTGDAAHARGLGLYIAKQIVNAHGGEIEVHSTAEDGTTFVVLVPRGVAIAAESDGGAALQDGAAWSVIKR